MTSEIEAEIMRNNAAIRARQAPQLTPEQLIQARMSRINSRMEADRAREMRLALYQSPTVSPATSTATPVQMTRYHDLHEVYYHAQERFYALQSQGRFCPDEDLNKAHLAMANALKAYNDYKMELWPPKKTWYQKWQPWIVPIQVVIGGYLLMKIIQLGYL